MRAGIRSLWKEERGVSVVIGAMLMLLVVATMWGTIQAFFVPDWNKDVEYEHLNIVHNDMITFKSDVEDVAFNEAPKSSDFHMGVRYPNRMFLANPGPGVAGSLTSENMTVTIEYNIEGYPAVGTSYETNRIIYEVQGTVDSPKLVYEHGVIIRDYGSANATTDEQSLIIGDEIYIPVLTGNLTASSSMETESIALRPMSYLYSRSKIEEVTITIDTAYPEVWEQLLAGTSTDDTTVSVNQTRSQIVVTSNATEQIGFPTVEVTADALYAGLVTLSTTLVPVQYSEIDLDEHYPCILDISIEEGDEEKTQSTITATVKNVTAPYDIHADLTAFSDPAAFDPEMDDVFPDYSSSVNCPITATSWVVPNQTTVRWTNITHPEYDKGDAVIVSFWVINTENNMKFFTQSVFVREKDKNWY